MIASSVCCITLLFFQYVACSACENAPLVESKLGTIKGLKAADGDYYMYMGIPFAMVNISNPFGASRPYPSFENTFEAFDDSAMCPQRNEYYTNNTIMGTLDCLRLNVYVPTSANTSISKLPIMVWIYGGGFRYGSAGRYIFGPNFLVRHDVIIVTINYRLGPYGFMCLDIPEVTGNQGLKDQYLAFRWIKDNIQAFGGDPNQITLFGQSAGGHSIDLHLMSTKETLFNKVILQTGSSQALTVLYEPDKVAPIKLARYLGFETNDIRKALTYLSNADTNSVIAAVTDLKIQFKPCVETLFDDVEPFIAKSWIHSEVPKIKNMPVLMGFNKLELADILFSKNDDYFNNLTIVSENLKRVFNCTDQQIYEMKDIVSHYYFGDEEISEKVKWDVIRYSSDFTYIHPVHRTLQKYLENGAGKIYFYMFAYVGGRNALITSTYDENDSDEHLCCASHTDEVSYLFNVQNKPDPIYSDKVIIEEMTTMWTNFAKYSDPTPAVCGANPVKWEPVTKNIYYYLYIDTKLSLRKRPLHERMAFWDQFYIHNKKCQKGFD